MGFHRFWSCIYLFWEKKIDNFWNLAQMTLNLQFVWKTFLSHQNYLVSRYTYTKLRSLTHPTLKSHKNKFVQSHNVRKKLYSIEEVILFSPTSKDLKRIKQYGFWIVLDLKQKWLHIEKTVWHTFLLFSFFLPFNRKIDWFPCMSCDSALA